MHKTSISKKLSTYLLESRTPQENCWHHLLSWLNAFGHSQSNTNYGHSK